jgi:hypothetical protein
MTVLERERADLIAKARAIAETLARAQGTVHSRQVREAMRQQGLLLDESASEFWLGAVFRGEGWVWTGQWHTHSDAARNIHERTVKVWKLR